MQKFIVEPLGQYKKKVWWDCPHCGKTVEFEYTIPTLCPHCESKLPNLSTLLSAFNQDFRVKFFLHGKAAF